MHKLAEPSGNDLEALEAELKRVKEDDDKPDGFTYDIRNRGTDNVVIVVQTGQMRRASILYVDSDLCQHRVPSLHACVASTRTTGSFSLTACTALRRVV